jgi:hypothetical protein
MWSVIGNAVDSDLALVESDRDSRSCTYTVHVAINIVTWVGDKKRHAFFFQSCAVCLIRYEGSRKKFCVAFFISVRNNWKELKFGLH